MSTDSKELTFVRCPTCGSLVPAVSTRCKMCGAGLDFDNNHKQKTKASDKQVSRVRQKTGEFVASESIDEKNSNSSSNIDNDIPADDPLSAYIDELEEGMAEIDNADEIDDDFDDLDDLMSDDDLEKMDQELEEAPKVPTEERFDFDDELDQDEDFEESNKKPAPPISKKSKTTKAKNKITASLKESRTKSNNLIGSSRPITENTESGLLVGWLVNYDNTAGVATELRVGKYFVTAKSIKSSDFVIADDSISSPHALITVKGWEEVKVQDLMSSLGTFLAEPGSANFERKDEVFDLANGSRVKFGSKEYAVIFVT